MSEKDELGTEGAELPEETEADGGAGGTEDGTDW